MDRAGFDVWLASIRDLTAEQRGYGFRALALAEAEDDRDMTADAKPVNVVSPPLVALGSSADRLAGEVSQAADVTAETALAASASDAFSLAAARIAAVRSCRAGAAPADCAATGAAIAVAASTR